MTDIDNEILISLIQERPVLWDKTLDIFKDRNATRKAWNEVCLAFRRDFEQLEENERNNFGQKVMKRWKHLRDAFAKAEKNIKESKTSGSKKRKYIFNEEMQFLKKLYKNTETTESFIIKENKDETWQQTEKRVHEEKLNATIKEKALPRRKNKKMDEEDLKISKVLDKKESPNPQMSFYNSLLPHTENFNSSEWLQFQMEVLQIISKIKNQKVATPHYQGYSTQPLQHPYLVVPHYSQSPQFPSYNPSIISQNTQSTTPCNPGQNPPAFTILPSYPCELYQEPSPSLATKEKIKQGSADEHFAEYLGEDCERSSSANSLNSSSTTDVF